MVWDNFYAFTDGGKAVAFNVGQQAPNGVLSQTVATTAGQSYVLAFDLGAFSISSQDEQRLQLTVRGSANATLAARTISVFAPGSGTTYKPQSVAFVADGPTATVVFQDISATTLNVDLMLDNVRVTPQGEHRAGRHRAGYYRTTVQREHIGWRQRQFQCVGDGDGPAGLSMAL